MSGDHQVTPLYFVNCCTVYVNNYVVDFTQHIGWLNCLIDWPIDRSINRPRVPHPPTDWLGDCIAWFADWSIDISTPSYHDKTPESRVTKSRGVMSHDILFTALLLHVNFEILYIIIYLHEQWPRVCRIFCVTLDVRQRKTNYCRKLM